MRMVRKLLPLLGIVLISLASLYIIWPTDPASVLPSGVPWPKGRGISIGGFERSEMRLGLDLQGGTRLLLGATIPDGFEGNLEEALDGTIRVLRRRVDATGVVEAEITRQGTSNISVQLPGLSPEEARSLLGRTALLRFCESAGTQQLPGGIQPEPCDSAGAWEQSYGIIDGRPLPLDGRSLKANAFVGTDQLGSPAVVFEWQGNGPELSEQITTRLLQQPLGIFLDEEMLANPTVGSPIRETGQIAPIAFDRARELVVQLNSGALPLQLAVLQEQQVDATLGQDSVRQSVVAGQIGFLVVVLFMVLYYRFPGLIASAALLVYALLSLAAFKLIPVTLTLAGIGAFVLSIGMAVDANILIFERMKEELRAGRGYATALEAGFARAWPSIRDSNASTLITCLILYALGGGIALPGLGTFDAPLVQGFAVTLAVGVGISLFSAILVSRVLLRLFIGTRFARGEWQVPGAQPLAEQPGHEARLLDLVGTRNILYAISGAAAFIALVILAIPPVFRPGIEFTAGTTTLLQFAQAPSQSELRTAYEDLGHPEARIQSSGEDQFLIRTGELRVPSTALVEVAPTPAGDQAGPQPVTSLGTLRLGKEGATEAVTLVDANAQGATCSLLETVAGRLPAGTEATVLSRYASCGAAGEVYRVLAGGTTVGYVRAEDTSGFVPSGDNPDAQPVDPANERQVIESSLRERFGDFQVLEFAQVTPVVSSAAVRNATLAVIAASVFILIYIAFAFSSVPKPLVYGVCAIIAMAHDVIITLGFFSLMSKVTGLEINLMFVTALLTVIGFSVHDSIVVFDRIRENVRQHPSLTLHENVNSALLQTLARSFNTSVTVLLSVTALLLLGGPTIREFLLVILVGVIAGTYSSVAVAAQLLVSYEEGDLARWWNRLRGRRHEPQPAS